MLLIEALGAVLLGLAASLLGSMLGIGGGIIIVPVLTVFFGTPIHTAIGAGLVTVITTSTVTGSTEARAELTHIRLAMLLEIATTIGAVMGALLSLMLGLKVLAAVMSTVLVWSALRMMRQDPGSSGHSRSAQASLASADHLPESGLAKRLRLAGSYFDESQGRTMSYQVSRTPIGLGLSGFAGAVSGLLGVGGGVIKVPAMATVMGVPIKVAAATSNLMIGVTACASASVFYMHGTIDPLLASLLMLGVVPGSSIGMLLASKAPRMFLRALFAVLLLGAALLMLLKAFGVIA
ncbi:MAG: sulfite exporter TauE/SafE family protein [Thermoplasmata archaeon]